MRLPRYEAVLRRREQIRKTVALLLDQTQEETFLEEMALGERLIKNYLKNTSQEGSALKRRLLGLREYWQFFHNLRGELIMEFWNEYEEELREDLVQFGRDRALRLLVDFWRELGDELVTSKSAHKRLYNFITQNDKLINDEQNNTKKRPGKTHKGRA